MAQKKNAPKKEETKKVDSKAKKETSGDDKAAKRAARMEALKSRPAEQRPNSRQVDIIKTEGGSVETFGYAMRKTGTLVTAVAKNSKGEVVGVSTTFIPGTRVKVKKNHGAIQPGVAGSKKGAEASDDEDED